jgi:hypothetical protein
MRASDFRQKVQVVSDCLEEDYEKYLPDDMESGTVDTTQLLQDFVTYRKRVE